MSARYFRNEKNQCLRTEAIFVFIQQNSLHPRLLLIVSSFKCLFSCRFWVPLFSPVDYLLCTSSEWSTVIIESALLRVLFILKPSSFVCGADLIACKTIIAMLRHFIRSNTNASVELAGAFSAAKICPSSCVWSRSKEFIHEAID
jgi:hypothetical protein